jgi:hypothetical protein
MISSFDINNEDNPDSTQQDPGPRPLTPRFIPASPPASLQTSHGTHPDVTYNLAESSSASVCDSQYRNGRLLPGSQYTAEEKEAINDEID